MKLWRTVGTRTLPIHPRRAGADVSGFSFCHCFFPRLFRSVDCCSCFSFFCRYCVCITVDLRIVCEDMRGYTCIACNVYICESFNMSRCDILLMTCRRGPTENLESFAQHCNGPAVLVEGLGPSRASEKSALFVCLFESPWFDHTQWAATCCSR